MRILLLACLWLTGCAAGPQALGVTGPGGQAAGPPAAVSEPPLDPMDNPAILQSGGRYGPNYTPTTGGGRFWGYN